MRPDISKRRRYILFEADRFLRQSAWLRGSTHPSITVPTAIVFVVLFGAIYGAVMGGFGGFAPDRALQIVYSAVKVPMLLALTFSLSLPSFFVLNTLFGVRSDFREVLRALVACQAGLTIILASLGPYTVLWYASSADYEAAILFNGLVFGFASVSAQLLLVGYYRPLIFHNRRHRWLLRIWVFLYAFVGVQMGWVLRPFVGSPAAAPQFVREGAWSNAYVVVARLISEVVAP